MPLLILLGLGLVGWLGYEAVAKAQTKPALPAGTPGAAPSGPKPPPATYELTAADSTKTLSVKVGDTIHVTLPYLSGQGVGWIPVYDAEGWDFGGGVIHDQGSNLLSDSMAFTLVAQKPGTAQVKIALLGPQYSGQSREAYLATAQATFVQTLNVSA